MKNIIKRFLYVVVVFISSILVCEVASAKKLSITADLSANQINRGLYIFPEGYAAFFHLYGCEHEALRVIMRDTNNIHLGVGFGSPTTMPQPLKLQYNVVLEYDEEEAKTKGLEQLVSNGHTIQKGEVAEEAVTLPTERSRLNENLNGYLVCGGLQHTRSVSIYAIVS